MFHQCIVKRKKHNFKLQNIIITRKPNTDSWPLANSHIFAQLPQRQLVPGIITNSVELVQELGRRITAVTEDTRKATLYLTCSSGCQWFSNEKIRSPSTALSPPSKRRCGLACIVFNILFSGILVCGKMIITIVIIIICLV